MKKGCFRILIILILILPVYLVLLANKHQVRSIPPKNVKDVLSSSQLSYYGGIGVGTSAGDSIIKIDIGTSFPSRTSNNLFVGDTVSIGIGGSQSIYYIKDVGNTATIMINTGISAVAIPYGGAIISTRSAVHTVSFEPQVNAVGGFWQFLIKATSTAGIGGTAHSDKIPDQDGFDAGALTAAAITCPFGGGAATIGTTAVVVSGSPSVSSSYHVIKCPAGAGSTNPVGVAGSMVVGVGNSELINPSPNHTAATEGVADIFTFILRYLDSGSNLLDQSIGKIAVVESVRVTATVDPSITFTIDNIGTTNTDSAACGTGSSLSSAAVSTTADAVSFGSLSIGGTGNQLAQRLSCLTNATGGYVVTAYEAGTMKNINTATTLPDTACNTGSCTITSATPWTTASTAKSEFGYTMTNIGSSIPFVAGNFKPFGIGASSAQDIMKRATLPSATESAYVCYRITVHTGQEAGDYEAKVIYTATATF